MLMSRPPYRLAAIAALLVFAGYVGTLAPTVTFWDAGEFIAAARTLGIPHPPGTPLYVMIAHVWGAVFAVGEYAWRLNLLSAILGALGAACFFLVIHEGLARWTARLEPARARLMAGSGALAGVLIAAFTFTAWQNSNETEVYAVAMFTIAALCWTALRWRAARGSTRAPHLLLLMLYLGGLSIGNHLLALLAGPAVIAFLAATLVASPAAGREERAGEWAQVAVMAGTWALLIGTGLGSTALIIMGAVCYLTALGAAIWAGTGPFAAVALVVALIGVSSYLFLFIRSGQHPIINEAQPDNWNALLAVIRRAQYPVRTPLDDPTVLHGPDNPGRTLGMLGLQLGNYLQYFDWQWGLGLGGTMPLGKLALPVRSLLTVGFTILGVLGLRALWRADRPVWWLLVTLFLTTGLALVLYMNFKPGYSLGYARFTEPSQHEVRERDYFFVASFVTWGLAAGAGLATLVRWVIERSRVAPVVVAAAVGLVALVPFAGNFTVASRRHGPDSRLAADFAYNLLNSVPPHAILFTYGDNDTFPLWWAQEVEGIRRDVTVVCLALSETPWYIRQLRDNGHRPFDETAAPAVWKGRGAAVPTQPTHTLTDAQVDQIRPTMLPNDLTVTAGSIQILLRRGTVLTPSDFTTIRILQENAGRRPIAWALTTGRDQYGLDRYLVQQGLVTRLETKPVDSTDATLDFHRVLGTALDIPTTERLLWDTYRYAGLLAPGSNAERLESTSAGVSGNLSLPYVQLTYAHESRGEMEKARAAAERAAQLSPNPALRRALLQAITEPSGGESVP
jgi:transmembrane protein TMEM260 (protein O-mannosyltransferase)